MFIIAFRGRSFVAHGSYPDFLSFRPFLSGIAGDAVKTEADFIAKTNDEDGVAETIRRILLPINRNEV